MDASLCYTLSTSLQNAVEALSSSSQYVNHVEEASFFPLLLISSIVDWHFNQILCCQYQFEFSSTQLNRNLACIDPKYKDIYIHIYSERRWRIERGMEGGGIYEWSVVRSILAILQWWGFNVTVIIINKWIFQVRYIVTSFVRAFCMLNPLLADYNIIVIEIEFLNLVNFAVSCVLFNR